MRADAIFAALGRLSVRFRWLVLLAWVAAAAAAVTALPSLSGATQNDNSKFLPASAPTPGRALSAADDAALAAIQARLRRVPTVRRVLDVGPSANGQAHQYVVLSAPLGDNQNAAAALVDDLRAAIRSVPRPAGLQVHLAGNLAIQVDQQKANGTSGNEIQLISIAFILVLLILIFRSFTLAMATLIPPFIAFTISGPLVAEAARHGLKVSPIAQFLMIVLVLGA